MDFSALLQALQDENEGTVFNLKPAEYVPPTPKPAVAPQVDSVPKTGDDGRAVAVASPPPEVTRATPPPSEAAPTASFVAPPEAPKNTFKEALDHFGLDPKDLVPKPPRSNALSQLTADLGRAGNTLGTAIATPGAKPDQSYFDRVEARGAQANAAADAQDAEYNKFKQNLVLRYKEAKAKAGDDDPELAKPGSPKFQGRLAQLMSTPETATQVTSYMKRMADIGFPPDLNAFKKIDAGKQLTASVSTENSKRAATEAAKRQKTGQDYDSTKRAEEYARHIGSIDYHANIDLWKEQRHGFMAQRAPLDPNNPPSPDNKNKVEKLDAQTGTVVGLVNQLKSLVDDSSGLDLQNPLRNRVISTIHQKLLNGARVAEDFGVPSGKDMDQLAREIEDPTKWRAWLEGKDQVKKAWDAFAQATADNAETFAYAHQYNKYGTGGQGPQAPDIVRKRILGEGGAKTPVVPGQTAPAAGGKVAYVLNGKRVSVPAEKAAEFEKDYPAAVRQ